jgi:hypothetical protein
VPKNEFVFELAEVWHMDIMRRRIEMNCKVVSRSPRPQKRDLGGTAKQAAEKGPVWRKCPYELLQGLKPNVDLMGFIGTTKVMP